MFLHISSQKALKKANLKQKDGMTVHKLTGVYEPDAVMSRAYASSRSKGGSLIKPAFFNLETYKISALVPELRFFKFEGDVITPFYFPISAIGNTSASLVAPSRTGGAGITRFDVKYLGTDPFTAPKYLEANLTLFVDNLENIFVGTEPGYAPLADLFTISVPKGTSKKTGDGSTVTSGDLVRPIEIAATLGYSLPNRDIFTPEEIDEIRSTNISLRMNVYHHQININQDGSATIDVKYTARIDNTARDKLFSAIDSPTDLLARADIRQLFDSGEKKSTDLKKKNEKQQSMIQKLKKQEKKMDEIRQIMEILESQRKIYSVQASSQKLLEYSRFSQRKKIAALIEKTSKLTEAAAASALTVNLETPLNLTLSLDGTQPKGAALSVPQLTISGPPPQQDLLDAQTKSTELLQKIRELDWSERSVHYVLFGDLVEAFFLKSLRSLQEAKKLTEMRDNDPRWDSSYIEVSGLAGFVKKSKDEKTKIKKVIQGALNKLKTFRVVLSDIEYKYHTGAHLTNLEAIKRINIADIPISLDVYQKFMFEKVTNNYRNTYTIPQFLNNCIQELLPSALTEWSNAGIAPNIISAAPTITSATFSGPQLRSAISSTGNIDVADLPSPMGVIKPTTVQDECDYFLMYQAPSRSLSTDKSGNIDEDSKKGIYHFLIGKNRGLIKEITFSRFDVPFAQEQLMTNQVGLYDELKMPYKANITMFGNNLFMPGSQIYVDPGPIGFGSPLNKNSASYRLGLGGYYTVIDVSTNISNGICTTTLGCSFGAHPEETARSNLIPDKAAIAGHLPRGSQPSSDAEPQGDLDAAVDVDTITAQHYGALARLQDSTTGQPLLDRPLAIGISDDMQFSPSDRTYPILGVFKRQVNRSTGETIYTLDSGHTIKVNPNSRTNPVTVIKSYEAAVRVTDPIVVTEVPSKEILKRKKITSEE